MTEILSQGRVLLLQHRDDARDRPALPVQIYQHFLVMLLPYSMQLGAVELHGGAEGSRGGRVLAGELLPLALGQRGLGLFLQTEVGTNAEEELFGLVGVDCCGRQVCGHPQELKEGGGVVVWKGSVTVDQPDEGEFEVIAGELGEVHAALHREEMLQVAEGQSEEGGQNMPIPFPVTKSEVALHGSRREGVEADPLLLEVEARALMAADAVCSAANEGEGDCLPTCLAFVILLL